MRIILEEEVKTPLWLAWEDDWELKSPTPLISRALTALEAAPRAMQVSLNGGWHDAPGYDQSVESTVPHIAGKNHILSKPRYVNNHAMSTRFDSAVSEGHLSRG